MTPQDCMSWHRETGEIVPSDEGAKQIELKAALLKLTKEDLVDKLIKANHTLDVAIKHVRKLALKIKEDKIK